MRLSLDALTTNVGYSFISYYHKYFKFRSPTRKSVYIIPKKWTKTHKTRQGVYIVPKKWTKHFRITK